MMHLILVIAVGIILAASYLLTFALCRAATRRELRAEASGHPDTREKPGAGGKLSLPESLAARRKVLWLTFLSRKVSCIIGKYVL